MKYYRLLAALLFVPWLPLFAQVSVEVDLEQQEFLPGETLPVTVRIVNRSGQTLTLGRDPEWLTFSVEARGDFIVIKNGDAPVEGGFQVGSSQMATKHVDIAPYFVLTRQGRYNVTATVRLKDWDTQVTSKPKTFDVIDGAKLWSREFGVPIKSGPTNQPPEVRRFTLEQANYLRSQLRLYLRLTDASDTRVIKVFAIGPMVSFGQPEAQMDRECNLHVLYQTGAKSFNYTVCNVDGTLLVRQRYDYTATRPRLQVDERGNITVTGGARRVTSADLPPPPPPPVIDTTTPLVPPR